MADSTSILIVEDDPDTREAMSVTLQCAGFAVKEAANGREALAILHAGMRPALILLDLMMPIMDGREFRRRQLFENEDEIATVPVVILSAVGDVEQVGRSLGAAQVMSKPFEPSRLVDVVRDVARH